MAVCAQGRFFRRFFCILRNLARAIRCSHHIHQAELFIACVVWFYGYYPFRSLFLLFMFRFIGFRRLAPRIASKMVKIEIVICVSHMNT